MKRANRTLEEPVWTETPAGASTYPTTDAAHWRSEIASLGAAAFAAWAASMRSSPASPVAVALS